MPKRKKLDASVQRDVLVECGRRCCLCYGLQSDFSEKRGQIAHIDHNPSNNTKDNLVFFCFDHHDLFDSSSRQSKGITKEEVIFYRRILQADVKRNLPRSPTIDEYSAQNALAKLHQILDSIRESQLFKSSFLNGYEVQKLVEEGLLTISPFFNDHLTTGGYDLSVGEFLLIGNQQRRLDVDNSVILDPGETAILATREFVRIPNGVIGRITQKSNLARLGLTLGATGQVYPGYEGSLVLDIHNWGRLSAIVSFGMRIASIEFTLINEPPPGLRGHLTQL